MGDAGRLLAAQAGKDYLSGMMHRHQNHDGDALSEAAKGALERSGEQWTSMRAAVFETLARAEKPASAYDIAEALSREQGRRVAPNSIYRILDLFEGSNLVRKIESANAYVANAHPQCLHDCIFLVCDRCGQTTHVDDDRVAGDIRAAAASAGFKPDRPVIEVRGRCRDCGEA